jgi:hypothetical protein
VARPVIRWASGTGAANKRAIYFPTQQFRIFRSLVIVDAKGSDFTLLKKVFDDFTHDRRIFDRFVRALRRPFAKQ